MPKGREDLLDDRDLRVQVVGRLLPVGLVLIVTLVAERGNPGIHGHGDCPGGPIAHELEEGAEKNEDRGGIAALGIEERLFQKGEVPPIDDAVAVDEVQLAAHVVMSTRPGLDLREGGGAPGPRAQRGDLPAQLLHAFLQEHAVAPVADHDLLSHVLEGGLQPRNGALGAGIGGAVEALQRGDHLLQREDLGDDGLLELHLGEELLGVTADDGLLLLLEKSEIGLEFLLLAQEHFAQALEHRDLLFVRPHVVPLPPSASTRRY